MGPLRGHKVVTKEGEDMQKALHIRTTVQPGGKVEFASPEAGRRADGGRGGAARVQCEGAPVMEILNGGPVRRLFQTAER